MSYPIVCPSSVSHSYSLPCHPFWTMSVVLSALAPKFFKNLSDYFSRFHTNVQLPSCKTHTLHNSFFHEGSKLWNSLPTYLHNLSSRQFCSKVSDLFLTKKTNAWHLHGCNTNATAILRMLRLGHGKLNINGHYSQICQCAIKTEIHMFLECPSICASRQMLTTNVSKILVEENVFSRYEFAALNRAELVEIFFFDILSCLKIRPYACLNKRVCSCPKIHPFNITSLFETLSVCAVLFVCLCVIFLLC